MKKILKKVEIMDSQQGPFINIPINPHPTMPQLQDNKASTQLPAKPVGAKLSKKERQRMKKQNQLAHLQAQERFRQIQVERKQQEEEKKQQEQAKAWQEQARLQEQEENERRYWEKMGRSPPTGAPVVPPTSASVPPPGFLAQDQFSLPIDNTGILAQAAEQARRIRDSTIQQQWDAGTDQNFHNDAIARVRQQQQEALERAKRQQDALAKQEQELARQQEALERAKREQEERARREQEEIAQLQQELEQAKQLQLNQIDILVEVMTHQVEASKAWNKLVRNDQMMGAINGNLEKARAAAGLIQDEENPEAMLQVFKDAQDNVMLGCKFMADHGATCLTL